MPNFQRKITLKPIRLFILGVLLYFTQGLYHALSSCTPGQTASAELLFYILLLLIYMQSSFSPGQPYFLNLHLFLCHRAFVSALDWWNSGGKVDGLLPWRFLNPSRCWRGVYMHKYIHKQQQESRIYWCLPPSPELWWGLCQLSYFQCSFV